MRNIKRMIILSMILDGIFCDVTSSRTHDEACENDDFPIKDS